MTRIAVEPLVRKFGVGQESKLVETLEAVDRASALEPVEDPADVSARADGTFGRKGYRLTTWGLYQLCRHLGDGLYRLLMELQKDGEESSFLAAVGILNQLVRLRFRGTLSAQMLVVDRQAGLVDAVVSQKFRFLSNMALHDQVRDALGAKAGPARMYEAGLHGRWFFLRHYVVPPLFELDGFNYHAGYHFSNHEGGQASLHGGNTLVRAKNMLVALTPFNRGRHLRHTGRSFSARLGLLLQKVLDHEPTPEPFRAGIASLSRQPLGFGNATEAEESRRETELVSQLHRRGLNKSLAERVCGLAKVQPHDLESPRTALAVTNKELTTRTAWDLAVAMCREAKKCSIATRESVEQVCYALITSRTKLK